MPTPTAQLSALTANESAKSAPSLGHNAVQPFDGVTVQAEKADKAASVNRQQGPVATGSSSQPQLAPLSYTDSIKRYVARQPLQSASLAAAAGALAMLLLRTQWTRRTGSRKGMQGR